MEIKDIQKDYNKDLKTVSISIRTTKDISNWIKENKVSPTKLFNEAVKELMKK